MLSDIDLDCLETLKQSEFLEVRTAAGLLDGVLTLYISDSKLTKDQILDLALGYMDAVIADSFKMVRVDELKIIVRDFDAIREIISNMRLHYC